MQMMALIAKMKAELRAFNADDGDLACLDLVADFLPRR
jgi:hypothetical protein